MRLSGIEEVPHELQDSVSQTLQIKISHESFIGFLEKFFSPENIFNPKKIKVWISSPEKFHPWNFLTLKIFKPIMIIDNPRNIFNTETY